MNTKNAFRRLSVQSGGRIGVAEIHGDFGKGFCRGWRVDWRQEFDSFETELHEKGETGDDGIFAAG